MIYEKETDLHELLMYPQSSGGVVAAMWCAYDEQRMKRKLIFPDVQFILNRHNVRFRSIDLEMLFKASISSDFRYIPAGDFESMCYMCIDFTTLTTIIPEPIGPSRRGINRIKSLGKKGWI